MPERKKNTMYGMPHRIFLAFYTCTWLGSLITGVGRDIGLNVLP